MGAAIFSCKNVAQLIFKIVNWCVKLVNMIVERA